MSERTFIMLKPDCLRRGLVGEVISRIEKKSYRIGDMKMMTLNEEQVNEHYAHIKEKPFFPLVVDYMLSGPVISMVVEGYDVVQGMRRIIGATRYNEAVAGTIRGDFAFNPDENIIHASDSPENAQVEIKRFLG